MDPDDQRWRDILERAPEADGRFFYGVTTTGIFCRPTCPSRRPRRDNVRLFDSPEAAETAGFRPCKRCKPSEASIDRQRTELVARACRLIEDSEETVDLDQVAAAVGLSSYHFHRLFKSVVGITPKAYGDLHRSERLRRNLDDEATVTDAIYRSGYGSSAGFYADAARRLGMTPTRYRAGGRGETIRFAVAECSLGPILVAGTERGVCAVQFGDDVDQLVRGLQDRFPEAELVGNDAGFAATVACVVGLVEQPGTAVDLPLDIRGTAFQERVWQALQQIPAGTTATYGEIADAIGSPGAAQAVGRACGANTIAVAIPCHRVVRTDGSLSGYRWGIDRKRALLLREGAPVVDRR